MTTPDATPEYHAGDRVKFRTECGKGIVVVRTIYNRASLMIWDDLPTGKAHLRESKDDSRDDGSYLEVSEFEVVKNEYGEIGFKYTGKRTGNIIIINKHPGNGKSILNKNFYHGFSADEIANFEFSHSLSCFEPYQESRAITELDQCFEEDKLYYKIVVEQQTILM